MSRLTAEISLWCQMMLGTTVAVQHSDGDPQELFYNEDYKTAHVYEIPASGRGKHRAPSHKFADFTFTAYAPKVFRNIR